MDRIEALLAEADEKVKTESGSTDAREAPGEVMEGPAMPPSRSDRRSPSPGPSPRRRGRGRSPSRGYDRYDDYSPSGSPPRKRSKYRSPRRGERSPDRYTPRHYGTGRRDYYDDRPRYGRGRSPSPPRRKAELRAERDAKYNVLKEEREERTVFVQNLPLDIMERDLEDYFEGHNCPVRDVQLVVDKQRKFKGLAYVEFYQKESVPASLRLNGESVQGRKLVIESSLSLKNGGSTASSSADGPRDNGYGQGHYQPLLRLYVGNLDYGITQEMLRGLLQQFGPIESVRLQTEPDGHSKGHAFVQYYQKEHALAAFHQLNQTQLANRPLRCDFTKDARTRDPDLPPSPPMLSGRTTYFPTTGSAVDAVAANQHQNPGMAPTGDVGSLDDEFKPSNASMHNLIQRLAASGTSASGAITAANVVHQPPPVTAPQQLIPQIDKSTLPNPGTPSNCMCLKNLFDPSTETDPNFDKEIELDVTEEAEERFGHLNHIFVDKTSFGDVYLRFDKMEAAFKAVEVMHGRFFATRLVRVEYIAPDVYAARFAL